MPIYEYYCKSCEKVSDVMRKISDPPLDDCPICHKSGLERWVSAPGVQFKGTGWYITDYKNKDGQKDSGNAAAKSAVTTESTSSSTASSGDKATTNSTEKAQAKPNKDSAGDKNK